MTQAKSNLRPDLWDGKLNSRDREVLTLMAEQYELDPLTGDLMMLRGKVYITAAGLQKLAVRDPSYEGCEIEIVQADWEKNFYVIKARVWKKGCSHPFEDFGDADPSTSSLRGRVLFRHAITRARARAMRSAFAIPFCSVEELDDEGRNMVGHPKKENPPPVPKKKKPAFDPSEHVHSIQEAKSLPLLFDALQTAKEKCPQSSHALLEKTAAGRRQWLLENVVGQTAQDAIDSIEGCGSMASLQKEWGNFNSTRRTYTPLEQSKIREAKEKKKAELLKAEAASAEEARRTYSNRDEDGAVKPEWAEANRQLRGAITEFGCGDAPVKAVLCRLQNVESRTQIHPVDLKEATASLLSGPNVQDSQKLELFRTQIKAAGDTSPEQKLKFKAEFIESVSEMSFAALVVIEEIVPEKTPA